MTIINMTHVDADRRLELDDGTATERDLLDERCRLPTARPQQSQPRRASESGGLPPVRTVRKMKSLSNLRDEFRREGLLLDQTPRSS